MSDVAKETGTIWSRLFDHKAFLNGEIRFYLHEFEETRRDQEVQNLFLLLEKITDIKGSQIEKVKQTINCSAKPANDTLKKALLISDNILDLDTNYRKDTTLELCRESRKQEWEKFVDDISFTCKRLDNTFEEKEEELQEFYRDLERKLNLKHSP